MRGNFNHPELAAAADGLGFGLLWLNFKLNL
jgi:hypothetical protein